MVRPPLLGAYPLYNLHPSLLPRWRGAAPVERAIMAGDRETGVTIIKLVEELDAGPIAAQRAFPVDPDDDAGAVHERAAAVAAALLDDVFRAPHYADRAFTRAAEKLDPRDRALDQQIAFGTVQRVRALDHGIEQLGRRPVRKLDPPVRAALRTGAYQLAYLDGVPAHAAVNETVEL